MKRVRRWRFGAHAQMARFVMLLTAFGTIASVVVSIADRSFEMLVSALVPALIGAVAWWLYSRTFVVLAEQGLIIGASGRKLGNLSEVSFRVPRYPSPFTGPVLCVTSDEVVRLWMLSQGNYWTPRAHGEFVDELTERGIHWTWYDGISRSGDT